MEERKHWHPGMTSWNGAGRAVAGSGRRRYFRSQGLTQMIRMKTAHRGSSEIESQHHLPRRRRPRWTTDVL